MNAELESIRVEAESRIFHAFKALESGFFGHFAAALAKAWFLADSGNQALIEQAFPHLVNRGRAYVASQRREAA